eukprot:Pgem_evm2s19037
MYVNGNEEIPDQAMIAKLIKALKKNKAWDNFTTTIAQRRILGMEEITFDKVCKLALCEELNLKSTGKLSNKETALYNNGNGNKNKKPHFCKRCFQPHDSRRCTNKILCRFCKGENHLEKNCWKKHGKPNTPKDERALISKTHKSTNVPCMWCKETDHLSNNCWYKGGCTKKTPGRPLERSHQAAEFIIDTGATSHLIGNEADFEQINDTKTTVAGISGSIVSKGEGKLKGFEGKALLSNNNEDLLSVSQLAQHGWTFTFNKKGFMAKKGKRILRGILRDNLYYLEKDRVNISKNH